MNRLIIIIFIFLSILTTNMLYSYPYINDNDCTTFIQNKTTKEIIKQEFDSNTKVTFYGDSRMQLAHFLLPYGIPFVGLDFFLGALPEGWNEHKSDVGFQGELNQSPLLSQDELNQINDRNELPNEPHTPPPNPEPNFIELWIICRLIGLCKK